MVLACQVRQSSSFYRALICLHLHDILSAIYTRREKRMSFTIILAVVYAALIGFAAAAFAKKHRALGAACCGRGIDCRADVYVDQLADVT